MANQQSTTQKSRLKKTGVVLSTKMDKTIVVQVEYKRRHEKYRKVIKSYSKFYAHDKNQTAKYDSLA